MASYAARWHSRILSIVQLMAGMTLGPYEIVEKIGAGGMGTVYRARDARLDRAVAIKVLTEEFAAHPKMRERLGREARAVSALSHPNIVPLYDIGSSGGIDYLVMELIDGESLAERLTRSIVAILLHALANQPFPHYDVATDGRFLVRELASGRDDDPVTLIVSTGPMTDANRDH